MHIRRVYLRDRNTGAHEFLCIRNALIPQRVVFRGGHERWRQSGHIL